MDTTKKIEQLQAEIDAINHFDPMHTICSSNYIIELGYEIGKASAAVKQDDGNWNFISGIDVPHLSFTGNVYNIEDWYINRPKYKTTPTGSKVGQWYKINGLTGFGRKNALNEILSHIRFTEFNNETFAEKYHDLFILGAYEGPEEYYRADEYFDGHTTCYFTGDVEDNNQACPVEERIQYLKKQMLKLKSQNEIENATGFNKVIGYIKYYLKQVLD